MTDALRELEAALATAFTLDNLQVYGDYLMSLGDPRGELIAVDVHAARLGWTPDVAHRRRRAIRTWLGLESHVDPTSGGWEQVRFACGFVDDVRIEYAIRVLAGPAGPFVRGLTLTNKTAGIEHALVELGRAPRPWLRRLTIAPRFRGEPPGRAWRRTELPNLANTALPSVIAATPRLERLELAGHRLVKDFAHPTLRTLVVAGIEALLPLFEARAPMPALEQLVLMFAHAPGEPVVLQRPWPELVPAAGFPALRRLDLSGNEAQRATTDTQVGVFEVLDLLGVREQLVELRLPSIRNAQEAAIVQRAIARMPELRRVEVMRGWGKHEVRAETVDIVEVTVPWPRYEAPIASSEMWIRIEHGNPYFVRARDAITWCERLELDDDARAAWLAWWQALDGLPDEESPAQALSAGTLLRALESVGYIDGSRGELREWTKVRQHLRTIAPEAEVLVARRRRRLER